MTDYINIGASPPDEDCAQLGSSGYRERAVAEMKRYRDLIREKCGKEPPGARLVIKWFEHDFGSYAELVVEYEEGNERAFGYALHVESKGPRNWDGDDAEAFR